MRAAATQVGAIRAVATQAAEIRVAGTPAGSAMRRPLRAGPTAVGRAATASPAAVTTPRRRMGRMQYPAAIMAATSAIKGLTPAIMGPTAIAGPTAITVIRPALIGAVATGVAATGRGLTMAGTVLPGFCRYCRLPTRPIG